MYRGLARNVLFLFAILPAIMRQKCKQRVIEYVTSGRYVEGERMPCRSRHNIMEDNVFTLQKMQIEKYEQLFLSWKRVGILAAFDGSEDHLLHSDLSGTMKRRKHYKRTIPRPQTAMDRLNVKLPKGPKEFIVGSRDIYFRDESSTDSDAGSDESDDGNQWIKDLRKRFIAEVGMEKIEKSPLTLTASEIPTKCPDEWLRGEVAFLPPAKSIYSSVPLKIYFVLFVLNGNDEEHT